MDYLACSKAGDVPDETNDNEGPADRGSLWAAPGGHGQAALLLVESLIHALIEKDVLDVAEAAAVVETARDVSIELGEDLGDGWEARRTALAFLSSIALSLRNDVR